MPFQLHRLYTVEGKSDSEGKVVPMKAYGGVDV
jgi:hypothetical protein